MALPSSTTSPPANDLLTSLSFSPLSTHLALSSLDHTIRILHPSPPSSGEATEWTHHPREWKAHDGPVLCLAWAAPEFGNVLASGGVDGAVKVWREDEPPPAFSSNGTNGTSSGSYSTPNAARRPGPSTSHHLSTGWSLLTPSSLPSPSFSPIRSLSFSPPDFGLKLAAVSSDNHLRVWECLDPIGGKEWVLVQDIEVASLPLGQCSAASIAGGVALAGLDSTSSVDTPGAASSATGSVDGQASGSGGQGTAGGMSRGGTVESDGGWAVSWCKEHWWGERLAVSTGTNGLVRLFHFPASASPTHSTHGPWSQFLTLLPSSFPPSNQTSSGFSSTSDDLPAHSLSNAHTPPTSSLSFAPPSGRSYQLLAAGARDGRARVWKLFPPSLAAPAAGGAGPSTGNSGGSGSIGVEGQLGLEEGDWTAKLDVELDASGSSASEREGRSGSTSAGSASAPAPGGGGGLGSALSACKVEWNVTGTVLSTSGGGGGGGGSQGQEEGRVRLWKPTYTGQWRLLASLSTEDAPPMSTSSTNQQHGQHQQGHQGYHEGGGGGSPLGGYRVEE
ncbi:hypothetical protein JCM11251_007084 [Rhodosporidiobolus azoricus]